MQNDLNSTAIHSNRQFKQKHISIGRLRSRQLQEIAPYNRIELRPISQNFSRGLVKTTLSFDKGVNTTERRKKKKNVLLQTQIRETIPIIQSEVYPLIYFTKKTFRQILNEIKYDQEIRSLGPSDQRKNIILGLVHELFDEVQKQNLINCFKIPLSEFNIVICQHRITRQYFIYFSDCELVPCSKCCNEIVYVELSQANHGRVICNNPQCMIRVLSSFDLTTSESQVLWRDDMYMQLSKVSTLVSTGRHRKRSLSQQVQKYTYQPTNRSPVLQEVESFLPQKVDSQTQYKYSMVENLILNGKVLNKNFSGTNGSNGFKNLSHHSIDEIEQYFVGN